MLYNPNYDKEKMANLAKEKSFTGLILYTGERTMSWSNGMFTVPINNLWEQ